MIDNNYRVKRKITVVVDSSINSSKAKLTKFEVIK